MRSMTIVNGSAATIAMRCSASRPPETNKTAAAADTNSPQVTFFRNEGVRLPSEVIMDNTKVAESAEVTKNTPRRRTVSRLSTAEKG